MFRHAAAIGADIGSYSLRIAVVNIDGDISAIKTYPLDRVQSADYIISILHNAIAEIRQSVAPLGINPICIGIAAKGFIDHKSGIIRGPDQGIRNWTNVPIAAIVNQESGLPVFVENDANMMTIAEHRFGAAKGYKNVVFVALRTGIGGGIIIDGKLYRGVNNAAGEVGQMIIKYDNGLSDKGIKGSYEQFASGSAVVRRYYEESGADREQGKMELACREIFELSYKNDATALKVVKENAGLVGIGLANLISVFAPEIVVVGGGLSEADGSWFDRVKKTAYENSLENCRKEVLIEKARLGSSGSLLGSAFFAMTRLAGKNI
jgi:glucokinase